MLATLCNRRSPANSDRTRSLDRAFLALTRQPNILITPLRGDPFLSFGLQTPGALIPYTTPACLHFGVLTGDRVGYPSGWATFQGRPWRAVHRGGVTLKPQRLTGNGVPHPPSRPGGTREARTNLPDPEVNLRRP